ncbi:MAG: hypothetical protein AB4038_05435 [Prochloraceae cyanobacterium]
MKQAFWKLTFAFAIIIPLSMIGKQVRTAPYEQWQIAQNLQFKRQERLLEVAIRESAIVRFKEGGSYSGKLTAFNPQNLTIEIEGTSETISLSQIEEVEFQGSIYIRGKPTRPPIRGIKILSDLPVTALELADPPIMASLSLKTMSSEGFERFSKNENCPCMISKIRLLDTDSLQSTAKMTVKLTEIQ